MKIFHFYETICVIVGVIFAIMTVITLDPAQLQFILKDANLIPHFLQVWAQATMYAIAVALFFGIPYMLTVIIFMSLNFDSAKY